MIDKNDKNDAMTDQRFFCKMLERDIEGDYCTKPAGHLTCRSCNVPKKKKAQTQPKGKIQKSKCKT